MLKIGTMLSKIRKEAFKDRSNVDLQNALWSILSAVTFDSKEDDIVEVLYESVTGENSRIRDFDYDLKQQQHMQKGRADRLRAVAKELKKMGFEVTVYARTHRGNDYVKSWAEEPFLSVKV